MPGVEVDDVAKSLGGLRGRLERGEGVSVDNGASKVLLTGGATTGRITLKAAPNAQPTEKQILTVMANVSINFVMKATYASDPVVLTVAGE